MSVFPEKTSSEHVCFSYSLRTIKNKFSNTSKLRKTCKDEEHRANYVCIAGLHRDIENVMAFRGDSDF